MISIFFCGDIVNNKSTESFVGSKISRIIQEADFAVCNLEGVELKAGGEQESPHQKYGTISTLRNSGFNLALLANNHITDGNIGGLKNTIDIIQEYGMDYVGAGFSQQEVYAPLVKNINNKCFAFFNLCEAQVGQYTNDDQQYGYAWIGNEKLFDDIRLYKQKVDHIVACVHLGLEHYDVPLPEVRRLYKKLIDCGADCVVGGHPHCAQGYEYYKKGLIIYSLGNFFFPIQLGREKESCSYSAIIRFNEDNKIDIEPVFHCNNGTMVELCDASCIDIDYLNSKLEENYEEYSRAMIDNAYNELCEKLLTGAFCGQSAHDRLKSVIINTIRYSLFRGKYIKRTVEKRQRLLLRMYENETYRWVITNYLRNKYQNV